MSALSLEEAERYCHSMARREAKNFYWGFISLPREQRNAIYALYDFARQVDDEADAAANTPDLPGRLRVHRERLAKCVRGEYDDPVMQVLSVAVKRFAIPEAELQMLVDGCEMDGTKTRYETWDELRKYCNLVASVVGRMCVRIFGFDDDAALERADDLGIALQLTNILRDVREDVGLGRIYLPQEDLRRFGITEEALVSELCHPEVLARSASLEGREGWEALIDFESLRAREYFTQGYKVLDFIERRPGACVRTMAGIYERILEKIERDPTLPLHRRAGLSSTEKIGAMVRAWLGV